jgi:cell division protein FtsQ
VSATTTYLPVDRDGDEQPPTRNRRRLIVLIVAGAVVVIVALSWLIAFSSVFGVGTVAVRGTRVLTAAQVRTAAHVTIGTPLVRLDTAEITRRVERLPDVASAQVSTSFPSTVDIVVTERRAVGYLRTGHGGVLVDRTGVEYRTVTTGPKTMPEFVVAGGARPGPTRAAVAAVSQSLPAALRAKVRSIQALDATSITLVLRHGRIVRWGNAQRNDDKARILPVLLQRKGTQIDVTDPDQPFTR